jgi:hypothetical protein
MRAEDVRRFGVLPQLHVPTTGLLPDTVFGSSEYAQKLRHGFGPERHTNDANKHKLFKVFG